MGGSISGDQIGPGPRDFLIQAVPRYSPSRLVQIVKSLVAREVIAQAPEVKQKQRGGAFWGEGYFVNTVGQHGSEKGIAAYVQEQGGKSEYRQLHKGQLDLGLS
jgi:REP element-mobilizing transposase RayT